MMSLLLFSSEDGAMNRIRRLLLAYVAVFVFSSPLSAQQEGAPKNRRKPLRNVVQSNALPIVKPWRRPTRRSPMKLRRTPTWSRTWST